jgi:hypothetical protein
MTTMTTMTTKKTGTTTESRFLLIRLREIGDVAFTTPLIRAVRETFPSAHLGFLVGRNERLFARLSLRRKPL